MKTLPQLWSAAMEATRFTGWIYDHLQPHAAALKVAHPLMLRAIAAAKRRTIALTREQDLRVPAVRFLPECYIGLDGNSRTAAYAALAPAGAPDGADENQGPLAADGSGRELQQAAIAQGRLLSRASGDQPGHR